MATIEELKADSERKMTSALKALHTELAAIRTGRATPSLLDQVKVLLRNGDPCQPACQCFRSGTPHDCDPALGQEPDERN